MNKEKTLIKRPRGVDYELTVRYDGVSGVSESRAWLRKKEKGWDYWVELSSWDYWTERSVGVKKLTPGHQYLVGESLKEVIANIERGGEYTDRKVVKIVELHQLKCK